MEGPFMSKKIYQVVDDMQDAVFGKSPKVCSLNERRKMPQEISFI
jgi:hypothetical protein